MSPSTSATLKPTHHHHHILIPNPFASGGSDEDTIDDPSSTTAVPSTPTNGLRAQLHHLLPRHTYFHARIQIHQVINIPLVSGDFSVKWKFKNVHTPPGAKQGLLGMVKGANRSRVAHKQEDDGDSGSLGSSEEYHHPHPPPPSHSSSGSSGSSNLLSADWQPPSTPSSTTFSVNSSSVSSRTAVSNYTASSRTSTSTNSSSSTGTSMLSPSLLSTATASTAASAQTTGANTPNTNVHGNTPARGQTPFLPLKDHNVTWSHTLDVLLRMDVDRDTRALQPSPLKLVVIQHYSDEFGVTRSRSNNGSEAKHTSSKSHKTHDHGKGKNHRLGAVYLDLAQYAGKGEVGRRYLLRESKVNATLKLTVHLTHASGPTDFQAPPLPRGEISNGISSIMAGGGGVSGISGILEEGFVSNPGSSGAGASSSTEGHGPNGVSSRVSGAVGEENTEAYRTRPRGLDQYGPYGDQEELELDLLGVRMGNSLLTNGKEEAGEGADGHLHSGKTEKGKRKQPIPMHARTPSTTPTFDASRLPHAYGSKTTETLIEALFNPVVVQERRRESPFTVYVEDASSTLLPSVTEHVATTHMPMRLGLAPAKTAEAGASVDRSWGVGKRPMPTRSGSGIGAGLGIMGLGMGMGVGMGVGVGVSGGRKSGEIGRVSSDGRRGASMDGRGLGVDGRLSTDGRLSVDGRGGASGRRHPSQGAASVWSSSTGTDAASMTTGSGSDSGHGSTWGGQEEKDKEKDKGGMRGWWKKNKSFKSGVSRPATPAPVAC